jgi:hypothetical protein
MENKKIGILSGEERAFPGALIHYINHVLATSGIVAEAVQIGCISPHSSSSPYTVILDRISHSVPFYR